MLERFKGKILIRRAKNGSSEKSVLILCGIVFPEAPIEQYSETDEMWVCELAVLQALKFDTPSNISPAGSLEDFLEGQGQDIKEWVKRDTD